MNQESYEFKELVSIIFFKIEQLYVLHHHHLKEFSMFLQGAAFQVTWLLFLGHNLKVELFPYHSKFAMH